MEPTPEQIRIRILELHFIRAMALMDQLLPPGSQEELAEIMSSFMRAAEVAEPGLFNHLKQMIEEQLAASAEEDNPQ